MTDDHLPRYRYWGDRKPNARLAKVGVATFMDAFLEAMNEDGDATPQPVAPEENPTVAVFRLYAPFDSWGGWWGINAEDVSTALDALPASVATLIIRINSPGGEVPEAMTILNMLRAHKAKTIAVVDGWAVSAASFVACGCDETVMSPGAEAMIHDARIFAYGDPAGLRKMADRMDTTSNNLAAIYVDKAGGTEADWRVVMAPETWYTAKEFVEVGLADRVAVVPDAGFTDTPGSDEPEADSVDGDAAENVFDLSLYRYAGRNQAPAPAAIMRHPKPPTASADGLSKKEGATLVDFTDEQIATLREQVGFPENADAGTITAAVAEALAERADAPLAASTDVPEGSVVVSKAEWEETRGDAQRGSAAALKLHEMQREASLDANKDKFLPANRDAWRSEYDKNPKATVEALQKRPVVIPLDELGHEVDSSGESAANTVEALRENPAYQNWEL